MDTREAREHLAMVDDILRHADASGWSCREMGLTLVGFGLGAGLLNLHYQTGAQGQPRLTLLIAGIALLLVSLAYMVTWMAVAHRGAERVSLRAVQAGRVMGAVWGSVFIASLCQPHVFSNWSASAIWSLGGAISMLVNGSSGDRRAFAGGIVLLASMLVANYMPAITGYALAGGFFIGYVLIGVLYFTGVGSANSRG